MKKRIYVIEHRKKCFNSKTGLIWVRPTFERAEELRGLLCRLTNCQVVAYERVTPRPIRRPKKSPIAPSSPSSR